jgi:glycosyltransferase involved in cell wall biosynthesis
MNYLRGLSKDYVISLISYEKKKDLNNKLAMSRAQADCAAHGIRWSPQLFRPQASIMSQLFSILKMIWIVQREIRLRGISLIHARSYIPASVALVVNRIMGTPFIFDMRALWPEELITSGRIRRGSMTHRVIVRAERACLVNSAAVVSLTKAAVEYLKAIYPTELKNQNIVVIPTCADVHRFSPSLIKRTDHIVHGCIGTVLSGWFLIDWLATWIQVAALRDPNASFKIVTRDESKSIRKIIDPENKLSERLSVVSELSEDMPNVIQKHDLSLMFFTEGLSKLGSAPTRLAEVLGCGLPVVVNEGVGDVAEIVKKNNVGVIVKGGSKLQIEEALDSLSILMKDPELTNRCRFIAKTKFSLQVGTEAYRKIYSEIINKKDISCAA